MSDESETTMKEMKLIDRLVILYPDSSKRTLLSWIEHGRILVDGKTVTKREAIVKVEQKIELLAKEKKISRLNIRLLYQDRWLVIIDKPANLLSVPLDERVEINALSLLRKALSTSSLFAVHRLDREASGILLFARGTIAEKKLEKLFEEHKISRHYFAVSDGKIGERRGTWKSYLEEKENYSVKTTKEGSGKLAITHFETLYTSKLFSYLHLQLETGRKHQIRVHTSEIGHPILGDYRYGSTSDPIERLALHAFKLEFIHPFTQKPIRLFSALPHVFSKIVPARLIEELKNV